MQRTLWLANTPGIVHGPLELPRLDCRSARHRALHECHPVRPLEAGSGCVTATCFCHSLAVPIAWLLYRQSFRAACSTGRFTLAEELKACMVVRERIGLMVA